MGREGYRRGQEADELAALSRALRESAATAAAASQQDLEPNCEAPRASALQAVAAPAPAAAAAAATEPHAEPNPAKEKKKEKKRKEEKKQEKKEKKRRTRAESEEEEQAAAGGAGGPVAAPPPAAASSGALAPVEALLQRLEAAAAQLHSAAGGGEQVTADGLQQWLSELLACTARLDAALAAAATQPPAALRLLQGQAQAMQPPLPAPQLAALGMQAEAAAAAARRCLTEAGAAAGAVCAADAPLQPEEQARFSAWFLPRFADCYAAEVEALQDSEPPIPAGVLLQCVRLAADGGALYPPPLKRLVLAAGDAA